MHNTNNEMISPTEIAMESLKNDMIQKRHDAVEEIKDGIRNRIDDFAEHINEKYHMFDKRTQQLVELQGRELMDTISDTEWHRHEILELLKQDEHDALKQMSWTIEPEIAPTQYAPFRRFSANRTCPTTSIPTTGLPVRKTQYIQGIEKLGELSLIQDNILQKAFRYLQKIPKVVNDETAAQEAQCIVKVKHFLHTQWVREMEKVHRMYVLLVKGQGVGGRAMG